MDTPARSHDEHAAYHVRSDLVRRSRAEPPAARGGVTRTLDELSRRLEGHEPELSDDAVEIQASVALILCERDHDLSLLFIQRASHPGDRWSGHIAFPGGRVDAADASPRHAAERETREEVGLEIDESMLCGRLDDLRGFSESILVSGFVYRLDAPPSLDVNHEVEHAFWLSLSEVESDARSVTREFEYQERQLVLPAIRVLDQEFPVLWGISYRFLELLMSLCDRPIHPMPWTPDV